MTGYPPAPGHSPCSIAAVARGFGLVLRSVLCSAELSDGSSSRELKAEFLSFCLGVKRKEKRWRRGRPFMFHACATKDQLGILQWGLIIIIEELSREWARTKLSGVLTSGRAEM